MTRFEERTTGERFNRCTDQYFLFRRVRETRGLTFKVTVGVELALLCACVVFAVLERRILWMLAFFLVAAVVLLWHVAGELQGRDTRNFILKARKQVLSPEEAAKELVITFDDEGCTFSAPGSTLPGRDVETQKLFTYAEVGDLFVSEDYMLVASQKAGSVCFAKADLTEGTAEELTAFLEEKCGRKAMVCQFDTDRLQALLK